MLTFITVVFVIAIPIHELHSTAWTSTMGKGSVYVYIVRIRGGGVIYHGECATTQQQLLPPEGDGRINPSMLLLFVPPLPLL